MRRFALASIPMAAVLAFTASFHAPADDLDALVLEQMAHRHINGVSLAIVQDGKIIIARAYGVTDRGDPRRVDSTTLFQAGSISKAVSALGALRLVEQHKLDLDSDINKSLKSWQLPSSSFTEKAPATLRLLLSHSAGITVHGFPGYDVDSARPSVVQVLNGTPPTNTPAIRSEAVPGAKWNYSGGGYTIMQLMMTDITGQSFPEYMRQAVLAPLGMTNSSFEQPLPRAWASRTAAGHFADGSKVRGRWHVYPEMAAAGLWTTASDLARFAIGVQEAYAGKSSAVITQAMAKQMLTDQKEMDGLGVMLQSGGNALRFSHNGRDEGFDANLMATAQTGQAYAIMINANDDSRFMTRLGNWIALKYRWPGVTPYQPPTAVATTPARLEAAAGFYDRGNQTFQTFVTRDGKLFNSVGGGPDEEFVPVANDRYVSAERFLQYEFLRDSAGAVISVRQVPPLPPAVRPRLGPLLRAAPAGGLEPAVAARVDSVLRAMSVGGERLRSSAGMTEGARKDFGATAWRPIVGLRRVTLAGSAAVTGGAVVRHGGAVTRTAYYRVSLPGGELLVIVYLTKENLVTDIDVIDE